MMYMYAGSATHSGIVIVFMSLNGWIKVEESRLFKHLPFCTFIIHVQYNQSQTLFIEEGGVSQKAYSL